MASLITRECYICEVTQSEYWSPNKGTALFLCRKCYRRYVAADKEKQYKKTAAEKERNWECYSCAIKKSRDWSPNPPTDLVLCSKCAKHYFRDKEKDHEYKLKKYWKIHEYNQQAIIPGLMA
ncbi:MAG: hypothetical protein WA364_20180 [Candidatus Nitrosopolaris sp.]